MERLKRLAWALWWRIHRDERGLTVLEYVIGAAVILVTLAAGLVAWNTGLVDKMGQLVQQLLR
jgi:Flp pilus assembly pilin Flp